MIGKIGQASRYDLPTNERGTKDYSHYSQQRDQRLHPRLLDGVVDVSRGVVTIRLSRWQFRRLIHLHAATLDHVHRVRVLAKPRCP